MPTVLRIGPYWFFFYSSDRDEPVHIHVEHEAKIAKFWLEPVRLERSGGFSRQDLNEVHRLVAENETEIVRQWHEFFSD